MPIKAAFHQFIGGKILNRKIDSEYPYLIISAIFRKISTFVRAVEETLIGMKRCISEKLATTT